nr:integrase, catalytic region, zinc finger, CCHC-type, peptidase aspartic, catalytic [Tanacetum cinerariifolium]
MAILLEDIQCAGSDTRPPMLDRTDFASWQQHIRLYCQGKKKEVNILKSIDEGPFQMGTIWEPLAEGTKGAPHLVKLNRGLRDTNYDQLYAYLKQHETHANENKMMLDRFTQHIVDPLALMSNVSHQQHYLQSSSTPPSTYVPPHLVDNAHLDSGLSLMDNLIENLTNTLALLTQSYKTFLPQTNNQLKTSSYTRNQATVQDGRVVVQNDLALNVDNMFQADDYDAFDFDVDEASMAQTMFMANLSSTDPVYDEARTLYDLDILSEYVKENTVPVVYSNVSSVPNDAYMMIYNDMYEPHAQSVSKTSRNTVVKNSLTAELATYKEQVVLYERRAMFELKDREQKINEQLRLVITDRNFKEETLKIELHSVKLQLASTINHNKLMSQDLIKIKTEALKEQTTASRPIKALMVYPPNTPATLVPRVLPMKSQVKVHIFTLIQLFSEFDKTCKKRITPTRLTEREKGFEQTKDCYLKKARCLELEAELSNLRVNSVSKDHVKPTVLVPGQYAIDVEPIPPRLRNNREAHLDYLRHLKESVETIREIVEEAKVVRPLNSSIVYAFRYTKNSQELLEHAIGTCPQDSHKRDTKLAPAPLIRKKQVTFAEQCDTSNSNTHKHVVKLNTQKTNVPVPLSTGVKRCTDASGSQLRSNTKKNRISPAKGVNKMQVEEQLRTNKSHLRTTNRVDSSSRSKSRIYHPLVFGLSLLKTYDGDRSRLMNFMKKFIRTVRFENDHFGAIMGYEDYVIGDSVISRVYYVEGLGHKLFFIEQFCDSDLEVAFRKHSCYVRDTNGVELIKGSRGSNLDTISVEDMMKSSPIYLLSKASKNKSWIPQQNGVVEIRNRSLVEAARTMLIFSKALIFLWAEAVATACYTKNQFTLVTTRPHMSCEDLGKLQPTADIGIFVGYAPSRKGYRIYNKRTRRIMETIHVQFDKLTVQAPVNSAGTPSSTTIDQDAPSPTESTLMEDTLVAPIDNNPFINVFAPEPSSDASSSGDTMTLSSTRFSCIVTIAVPLLSAAIMSSTPDTIADVNVNAPADQEPTMAPPTHIDDQILPHIKWFWDTVRYDKTVGCYKCQLDEQWFDLTKDTLRDALQITPVNNNNAFSSPPSSDAFINFVNDPGYPKSVRNLSNVVTNDTFQPWRALTIIINLCLTGKTSGFERPRAPVLQILWGVVN